MRLRPHAQQKARARRGGPHADRPVPNTGYQTTWSLKPGFAPYKVDYDPDSASTATMWATGEKTIDERLSQGPSSAPLRDEQPARG